jgi:hypothetical protein
MGHYSAPLDRLAKDIGVLAIVVAKLELRDVQRKVLGADLVKRAHHTALEDRPEAFDRVGVDRADDVLALGVVDNAVRIFGVEAAISYPLVGAKQAHLFRNCAAHEGLEGCCINPADDAGHDIPLAAHCADDRHLARPGAAAPASAALMPVLGLATDKRSRPPPRSP